MLRVGGTDDLRERRFYRACDELGILVWQDFMFASMDYPEDEGVRQLGDDRGHAAIARLQPHPSVALFCGNSEVEQQAAMLGLPRDAWRSPAVLRGVAGDLRALASGRAVRALDAQWRGAAVSCRRGITHYYGVGAYLRPVADARRAGVRFTAECLGFANVPRRRGRPPMEEDAPAMHHPRWKGRIPRDPGAGWDFEDVRDHYLRHLFGVDPVRLRSADRHDISI